jgi:crotonobetainyl-CoA:carnitine CoA-transferase CaiB-like acyl-CoA transferase
VNRPLDGILILDLTRAVAGPMCTMHLADLGARVIKVEEPGGDETRRWGPPFVEGDATYFLGLNRNKESAVLDLKNPADLALAQRIAARADIIVENYRPGVAARLGLGHEEWCARRPELIYASVSGFGQTGEDAHRPGYDLIVQAACGLMHTSGGRVSFPVADVLAALFLQNGILTALYRRTQTGLGGYIDVSLMQALYAGMSPLVSEVLMADGDPTPRGTAHANIVPYQVFQASDGGVAIGVTNTRIWERFCHVLEHEDWLADPRFTGNGARNENRDALIGLIEPVIAAKPAREWEALMRAAGVPCAAVRRVGELVTGDWTLDGGLRVMGNPVHLTGVEPRLEAVPKLGAHTARLRAEFAS